jgi:peptide chain release factor 1
MLDKLEAIHLRYMDIGEKMLVPEIIMDIQQYAKLAKEYKELGKIEVVYQNYKNLLSNIDHAKSVISTEKDEEFREMAKMELDEFLPQKDVLEDEIKSLLIPKDPNDSKNVILEIRAGAGGDEASIFAGDLIRMYQRFAEKMKWQISLIDFNDGSAGGYKEITCSVIGEDAYGMLKYESGVHRVQRVPATETQGRLQTSTASVVVLPEMEDVEVEINPSDVRIDTFCSSGPGGQSVNTTYSAVRLTHAPSGLVVSCQDEKSQIKNKEKAFKVLKSRLYDIELQKHNDQIGAKRKSMVGSGDRSEKIRTYNYPQSRVTDHRIGHTVYNLPAVMDGAIEDFIENLRLAENAERLKEGTGNN